MDDYQAYVTLAFPLIGLVSGALGKYIVDLLKRAGLKGRATLQPASALVCSGLATALLAAVGLMGWKAVPVVALLAWMTAEAKAKKDELKNGKGVA